jgi:bleomycin hydrolase
MDKQITNEVLGSFSKDYRSNPVKIAATRAFSTTVMTDLCNDPERAREMQFKFSVDIPTMKATSQNHSGRCWLFAATNVLREIVAKKKNIAEFELSQSYLAFWDKFERCNYMLEAAIETANLPIDDRTVSYLLKDNVPVSDGGQWDMFVNIVNKYGIVPKDVMPETFQSSDTKNVNGELTRYMRKAAIELRNAVHNKATDKEIKAIKEEYLCNAYGFMCECYAEPPKSFDFEYITKDKEYKIEKGYTPLSFKEAMIGNLLEDYVGLINSPTQDKPYDKMYTVKYLGNVVGGSIVKYLNLPMDEIKKIMVQSLKDGNVIWFGSDCGKNGNRTTKVWDDKNFDLSPLTGMDYEMSKAEMLDYGASKMNHAMVITGVNLDNDTPNRWKIENSWGSEGANGGYHTASDGWIDKYVYQIVVKKEYLGEKAALLKQKPVELAPWDPMGSLAD